MRYLLLIFLLWSCSHNLQKGFYRKIGPKRYLVQMDLVTPEVEKVFERVKDELCIRFHQGRAKVLSREFQEKKLVSEIECYQKGFPHLSSKPVVRFFGGEKGVGRFIMSCGPTCQFK